MLGVKVGEGGGMSKLHAQMALFGTIDEVLRHTDDVEIVQAVEEFMPGFTGFGKRGWYRELKEFLAQPELAPPDQTGPRSADDMFPSLEDAVGELEVPPEPEPSSEPPPPTAPDIDPASDEQTPTDVLRMLFASSVLGKLHDMVVARNAPLPPGLNFADSGDPLTQLLNRRIGALPTGSEAIPGIDPVLAEKDPIAAVRQYLVNSENLAVFQTRIGTLAKAQVLDEAVPDGKPLCTGGLRKINGQYCSVLTTDYIRTDLTVEHIKRVMEPHNWPKLCPSFFQQMVDQDPKQVRGWTRVLEIVSGDPKLWELRTALRYWKGETTPQGGFYINYDLDKTRTGDGRLVEVDAGYIMITPLPPNSPKPGVRIRTSKQVRIRGMSSTASAVLACFMGWGDVSSRMLTERAKPPPFDDAVDFGNLSQDPGAQKGDPPETPLIGDKPTDAQVGQAATHAQLPPGWRGALIDGFQKEFTKFSDMATVGASDFYRRYSDGMTQDDVKALGKDFGEKLTAYAAGLLNAATNATTQPDPPDQKGKA